jgi:hypothetical protein
MSEMILPESLTFDTGEYVGTVALSLVGFANAIAPCESFN